MKTILKNKLFAVFIIIMLCVLTGCNEHIGKSYEIAVIAKSTSSQFWQSVMDGVNAASTEYNVHTTFEGPEDEEDSATQNALIVSAIARRVDAIIISAIDHELSADAINAAHTAGIKIITIDSGVDSEYPEAFIGTDDNEAGILAARAAFELSNGSPKIGLVLNGSDSENLKEREEAFKNFIKENGGYICGETTVASDSESAMAGANDLLDSYPEINMLVGFNELSTLGIGYAIRERGLSKAVSAIGFDNNVISIGMLENGEMDTLIVQNPFAIGYLGIKNAVALLSGDKIDKVIMTSVTVVTKENMFEKENQRILFRFNK